MSEPTTNPWRALVRLIRPERARYGLLIAALTIASLPSLAAPLLVRRAIDGAIGQTLSTERVVGIGITLAVLAVIGQALRVVVSWFATTTAWNTANGLRRSLTEHVLGLDHEFHRSHTPGELVQRLDGDITSVSDFLGRVVTDAGNALIIIVGSVGVLFAVDWRLAIGLLAYLSLAAATFTLLRNRAVSEAEYVMGVRAKLFGGIEERLTASEDLRANGAGSHALARFVAESSTALDAYQLEELSFVRLWQWLRGALNLGILLSLIFGGWMVSRDAITVGTAFLLFQYLGLLERPVAVMVDNMEFTQKASGAMIRVDGLLATRSAIADDGATSPPPGALSIAFSDLSFDYGDDVPVLSDIDLSFDAGRSIGIVGRTGSGKTTLSRLVLRLIEATDGELRLGGVPIADIPQSELRRRVALIPQEVQLLRGTIRDNITLFDPGPSDEEVAAALAAVGLDRSIDTEVGNGGDDGLSAGEAQLVTLARVWLRRPDIIVLDEATARVDPATEAALEAAIAALLKGRTALIIAHRLSTLRFADEIVVVDQGRVVEHGDRAQLEADTTGRYRALLDLALETAS